MNVKIYNFNESFLNDIRYINVAVSSHPNKPIEEKKLCQYLYIDYYALNATDNCFVAINEDNNEVVGYVIAENNLQRYKDIILNDYMPIATSLREDFKQYLENEVKGYEVFEKEYPAHLHMDVKPGNQHLGIGSMLIQHEFKHLKDIGCKGVMLGCSAENIRANNFYQKNGMDIIYQKQGTNLRGKKL